MTMPSDKPVTKEVRAFLRDLRAFVGRHPSQRLAALELKIPLRTLESWLTDKRTPSAMAIRALSPYLKG